MGCLRACSSRKQYQFPIVIPQAIREAIASPNADGRHILMEFALAAVDAGDDHREPLARYYLEAVPKFGLGPFISRSEIVALQKNLILTETESKAENDKNVSLGTSELLGRLGKASPFPMAPSVSIVGFHRSVLGLGEDARSLFECLLEAGIGAELIDVSPRALEAYESSDKYLAFEASRPTGAVVIFCMPVFEMMRLICTQGLAPSGGQYWIGYWP